LNYGIIANQKKSDELLKILPDLISWLEKHENNVIVESDLLEKRLHSDGQSIYGIRIYSHVCFETPSMQKIGRHQNYKSESDKRYYFCCHLFHLACSAEHNLLSLFVMIT